NESKPKNLVPVDYGRANGGVEYRVKDGDKWESVAAQFGIDVRALINFNFKTNIPEEVNWYLRNHTGCNKPSPSGRNWSFSTSANPGIIYIPPKAKNKDDAPTNKPTVPPAQTTSPSTSKPKDKDDAPTNQPPVPPAQTTSPSSPPSPP